MIQVLVGFVLINPFSVSYDIIKCPNFGIRCTQTAIQERTTSVLSESILSLANNHVICAEVIL